MLQGTTAILRLPSGQFEARATVFLPAGTNRTLSSVRDTEDDANLELADLIGILELTHGGRTTRINWEAEPPVQPLDARQAEPVNAPRSRLTMPVRRGITH